MNTLRSPRPAFYRSLSAALLLASAAHASPISPVAPAASPVAPVQDPAEETAQIEADKKQLSAELAASWKETDRIKAVLAAQLADANKRLAIAETALANKDKEIAALQTRLATPPPTPAPAPDTAELDSLRRERDQLRADAGAASSELAALKATDAKNDARLADAADAQRVAESEVASLKSAADKASADRLALAAQLETVTNEAARLKTELETAKTAASADSPAVAELREKFAASEKNLTDAQAALSSLKASTAGALSAADATALKAERDHLSEDVAKIAQERDALARQLADAKTAAPVAPPAVAPVPAAADTEALKTSLAEAQAKLDASLRTYMLDQAEIDRLQKALANIDAERAATADKLDAATKELATLRPQAESGAASSTQAETLRAQLADTQHALGERTAALDHAVQDLAVARQNADAAAGDLAQTREQLRQTQAQAAASANEALQLKTRLALASNAPTAPTRPGALAPTAIAVETPSVALPAAPAKTEAPAVALPRLYVVTSGDSLSGIAKRYYGSASRWKEILDANRDVIRNPNALPVGTKLRIP